MNAMGSSRKEEPASERSRKSGADASFSEEIQMSKKEKIETVVELTIIGAAAGAFLHGAIGMVVGAFIGLFCGWVSARNY